MFQQITTAIFDVTWWFYVVIPQCVRMSDAPVGILMANVSADSVHNHIGKARYSVICVVDLSVLLACIARIWWDPSSPCFEGCLT